MKINNNLKLTGLALTLALASGCATPQRITQNDVRNFDGTVASFSANYAINETALDASQTNRESRCLADFVGVNYSSMSDLYRDLGQCVDAKRDQDMLKSLAIGTVIDGAKLFFVYKGFQGAKNTINPPTTTNTYGQGIGNGSANGTVGNGF